MAAKLIVTTTKGGSRIALVGTSGTELLASKVFAEPRAKGATLRSLKGLLGDDVVIEDQTVAVGRKAAASPAPAPAPAPAGRRASAKAPARSTRRKAAAAATDGAAEVSATAEAPAGRRKATASKTTAPAAKPAGRKKAAARKSTPAKRAVGKRVAKPATGK